MRRLVSVLLLLGLTASACSGGAPEPAEDDGIGALEQAEPGGEENNARKSTGKKGARRDNRPTETDKGSTPGKETKTGGASRSTKRDVATSGGGTRPGAPKPDQRSAAATTVPAGTYEYATDGQTTISGNSHDLPETTTLIAHAPRNGEQRQLRDLRDQEGNGTVTETRLLYRPDGVFLTYVKVTAKFPGGLTDVREFRPTNPELVAPTGGAPGFARSFSMHGSGTRAKVAIAALRYEKVRVGASSVKALVVDTKIEFSGSLEGEQDSVSWFWPKHVFLLREEVHTDVRNGPIRMRSDYVALVRRMP